LALAKRLSTFRYRVSHHLGLGFALGSGNQGQEDVFAFIAFRLAVIGDATRTSLGFTPILGGAARSTNREIPDSHLLDS
jgi:hypothetical protein